MLDRRFVTLALVMLTEVLGWSLILPFLPYYAESFGATPFIVGLIIATFSVFQFISAPIIGKLSDKYGRKPLLIVSQFSTFAGFMILGLADSLWMIFLSRIVDGLFGSNMTLTNTYITDITKGKKRAKSYSYFGAIFGLGFLIGPAIGGFLATINYSLPSFVAAGVTLLSIILTIFTLEETVTVEKDVKLKYNDFFPLKDFVGGLKNKKLKAVFIEFFFFIFGFTILTTGLPLYIKHQLGFGPEEVGALLMIIGLSRIVFQTIALPKLIDKLSERILNISGLILTIFAMMGIYFVSSRITLYAIMLVFAIGGGLTRPMIITKISKKSDIKERGKLMGVLDALGSVARIIGPLIGGFMIDNFFPGTIGILAGGVVLIALIYELKHKLKQDTNLTNIK